MEKDEKIVGILAALGDDKPVDVQRLVNSVLGERISSEIADIKNAMAQTYFEEFDLDEEELDEAYDKKTKDLKKIWKLARKQSRKNKTAQYAFNEDTEEDLDEAKFKGYDDEPKASEKKQVWKKTRKQARQQKSSQYAFNEDEQLDENCTVLTSGPDGHLVKIRSNDIAGGRKAFNVLYYKPNESKVHEGESFYSKGSNDHKEAHGKAINHALSLAKKHDPKGHEKWKAYQHD